MKCKKLKDATGNIKRPSKLLTKYNSLDSKEPPTGTSGAAAVEMSRSAITPSPGVEQLSLVDTASNKASSSNSSSRSSLKPKINHHSITPAAAEETDSGRATGVTAAASPVAPVAKAKLLEPTLTGSFSSNQLNSIKSVHTSHFDSSRSGSITSIMYAKSKFSSGYRLIPTFI